MAADIPEMTKKMQMLYMDIIASLGQLPSEMKEFIFGLNTEEDMNIVITVANYITLEFIKTSFAHCQSQSVK